MSNIECMNHAGGIYCQQVSGGATTAKQSEGSGGGSGEGKSLRSYYSYTGTHDLTGMDKPVLHWQNMVMDKCRCHAAPFGTIHHSNFFFFAQETHV